MRVALVPVKELRRAKRRLAPLLSPEERWALSLVMLQDTLAALSNVEGLNRLAVVTSDQTVVELARKAGAIVIQEDEQRSERHSVDQAADILKARGARSLLVIPADAPFCSGGEVRCLLEKAAAEPSITLVPSRDGKGTNAILKSPPDVIPSRFGYDSLRAHIAEARKRGVSYEILELPSLSLDIDEVEDLLLFAQEASETETYRVLVGMGVLERRHASPSA
ncbi:MAG: 2-phospho-L-lactate guanylyltransferase [candidate division NC10 bacterium]|nr:2-phospho-L-lactate guanylyltransferase [candidate division NC10 bacterium]